MKILVVANNDNNVNFLIGSCYLMVEFYGSNSFYFRGLIGKK